MTNKKCPICETAPGTIEKREAGMEVGEDGMEFDITIMVKVCEKCADEWYDGTE